MLTPLFICKDADELAARAAEMIIDSAQQAIASRGRFTFVLTGGSTPEKTYQKLAEPQRGSRIDWSKTFVFVGDERFVPPDDPRSNYGMADRSLLSRVAVPARQVFPVPTLAKSAEVAAQEYAEVLAKCFAGSAQPPQFDLILLGLGEDGHVASLFPGAPALDCLDRWVTWSPPGTLPPPVDRVTMTYPVLNAGRQIFFLVAGEKKAAVVREILEGHPSPRQHPAAGIRPTAGSLSWLLDEKAAQLLKSRPQSS